MNSCPPPPPTPPPPNPLNDQNPSAKLDKSFLLMLPLSLKASMNTKLQ